MVAVYDESDSQCVSLMAKDQYVRLVNWLRYSSDEEEENRLLVCLDRSVMERARGCSDVAVLARARQARDRLIELYQPMVYAIACSFVRRDRSGVDVMDLVQEGNMKLLHLLDSGCVEGKADFRAYAAASVRFGMRAFLAYSHRRLVKLPEPVVSGIGQLRRASEAFFSRTGRRASFEELAVEMGVTKERVGELFHWSSCMDVASLQGFAEDTGIPEGETVLSSVFSDVAPQEDELSVAVKDCLCQALDEVLNETQRAILLRRYGLVDEDGRCQSVEHICDELRLFYGTGFRSEQKGLRRLRQALELVEEDGRIGCVLKPEYTDAYCGTEEAAYALGVSVSTIRRYIASGVIPAKLGVIGEKDALSYRIPKQVIRALGAQKQSTCRERFASSEGEDDLSA